MLTRDEFVARMKKQLDGWNAEIDALEARARTTKVDAKSKYEELLASVRSKRAEGRKKLEAIKAAPADSWESLKAETEKVWGALKDSVHVFKSHFEQ